MIATRLAVRTVLTGLHNVINRSRYPQIKVGDAAPVAGLTLVDLNGNATDMQELLALDVAAGKLSVFNFGSYT